MNASPANPYDLLATDLRGLAEQEGMELWRNRHRLTGLMLDHQPDLRREIKTMTSAVELGVAQALADSDRSLAGIVIDRQAALMESEVGLRAEVAQNVVRAIAHALNLGPLPSVYVQDLGPRSDQRGSNPRHSMPPQPVGPPPQPQPGWSGSYSSPSGYPPHYSQPRGGGRKFVLPAAILAGAIAIAAGVMIVPRLGGGSGATVNVAQPARPPRNPSVGYGGELTDFRVAAQSTLQSDLGTDTPLTVPGGTRVTTEQLIEMMGRDPRVVLIDVLDGDHGRTLNGAHWMPVIGRGGTFTDENQINGKNAIDGLTGGDTNRALVFYCLGARCWESYNATLRAAAMGYTRLYWYRGGLQAWDDAGLPMQALGPQLGGN